MTSYPVFGEFDPLNKLIKQEKALIAAGAKGEEVLEALKEVRKAIHEMIESRGRQNEGGRHR